MWVDDTRAQGSRQGQWLRLLSSIRAVQVDRIVLAAQTAMEDGEVGLIHIAVAVLIRILAFRATALPGAGEARLQVAEVLLFHVAIPSKSVLMTRM